MNSTIHPKRNANRYGVRRAPAMRLAALTTVLLMAAVRAHADVDVLTLGRLSDIPALEALLPRLERSIDQQLARARIAAATHDERTVAAANRRLQATSAATPAERAFGWAQLAGVTFANGQYARAERAAQSWVAAARAAQDTEQESDALKVQAVAAILAGVRAQRLSGEREGSLDTRRDDLGLLRAQVQVNGHELDAVLDTGANLSVVSRSAATRLGVTRVDGQATIGSSTRQHVPAEFVVADELRIAGTLLQNVVFIVIEDEALTLPGDVRLDGILGFPVFRSLRHVTFEGDARLHWSASRALAAGDSTPLYADGSDLYVPVELFGVTLPLHLDTGASNTSLTAEAVTRQPSLARQGAERQRQIAGLGGSDTRTVRELAAVLVGVQGKSICLAQLDLQASGPSDPTRRRYGTLGQDVLASFGSYSLDLVGMRFAVGPAIGGAASPAGCAAPASGR